VPLPRTLTVAVASAVCALPLAAPFATGAPSASATYGVTWTVQPGANALSEYAPKASGSDAPIATIQGAATGLSAPSAITIGKSGNLFVANAGNSSITEYAADATGNAAPIATISGPHTGLAAPSSVMFSDGMIWVTDPSTNLVEAFSAGSSGDLLPAETVIGKKTHLDHPVAVVASQLAPGVEELSSTIAVLNTPPSGKPSVTSYFTGKRGNITPTSEFSGTKKHPLVSPTALLAVGFGSIWIADSGTDALTLYFAFPGLPFARVAGSIAGRHTGLDAPSALSTDAFGHLVVANSGDQTVRVFGAGARGNAAPLRTLTGVGTHAGSPAGVAVFGAPPGPPTNLKVKIHRATAKLSWRAPTVTGGGIAGYEVIAINMGTDGGGGGGSIVVSIGGSSFGDLGDVGITTRHTKFTKRHLKPGHQYLFAVAAVNAFGSRLSRPVLRAFVIPPSAPRKVRATTGPHSIAVNWKPPKLDGGQGLRRYDVEHATCVPGAKGCRFHTRHVAANGGYHPFPANPTYARITGLKPGTRYYVRVVAENRTKVGKPSKAEPSWRPSSSLTSSTAPLMLSPRPPADPSSAAKSPAARRCFTRSQKNPTSRWCSASAKARSRSSSVDSASSSATLARWSPWSVGMAAKPTGRGAATNRPRR
jgi:hypothetical protein